MKSTAIANSNTALIKYWGKYDEDLILPMNSNLSMTVDSQHTTTTVDFQPELERDEVFLNGEKAEGRESDRVVRHLDLIRGMAATSEKARVMSENSFPTAAGLASSASGFAALTVAGCAAAGLDLDQRQLSILSRRGSGSSCRSIYGGYVEWVKGRTDQESYAVQVADEGHFDLRDIAVVIAEGERPMPTREAMKVSIGTSPLFQTRLSLVEGMLAKAKKGILERDFSLVGSTAETDAILMHSVMMATQPPLFYWEPKTLEVMKKVIGWRASGLECYFTVDTGANMHIFCLPEGEKELIGRLNDIGGIKGHFASKPGRGARLVKSHLF
jgi:diphosphomevalonate decarboxylase